MSEDKPSSQESDSVSSVPAPSTESPSSQGVFSVKKSKRSYKRVIVFAAVIVILAVVGATIWWWLSQGSATTDKKQASSDQLTLSVVCDKAIMQSAGKPIGDNDITSLQPIAESIVQKKNYRGDVNCNYILMRYYLMIGDVSNARSTLDDLSYTYGHSGGYSTVFDPPAMSTTALKDSLDVMIANKQAAQKENDDLNGLDQ